MPHHHVARRGEKGQIMTAIVDRMTRRIRRRVVRRNPIKQEVSSSDVHEKVMWMQDWCHNFEQATKQK